jgi:prepilin-type N-terminal cleavage/methylation domain-containing protein
MTVFHRPPRGGVTLVELLCVMGIIAILVALSLGPILKAFAHAKKVIGH